MIINLLIILYNDKIIFLKYKCLLMKTLLIFIYIYF